MKKLIVIPFLLSITVLPISPIFAWTGIRMGKDKDCFVADLDGTTKKGFWYCGKSTKGCDNISEWDRDKPKNMTLGEKVNWTEFASIRGGNSKETGQENKSNTWYCCGSYFQKSTICNAVLCVRTTTLLESAQRNSITWTMIPRKNAV